MYNLIDGFGVTTEHIGEYVIESIVLFLLAFVILFQSINKSWSGYAGFPFGPVYILNKRNFTFVISIVNLL